MRSCWILFGRTPALVAAIVLVVALPAWGRPKTDVIELINGDRLTGEIKQLDHGKLSYKTDSASTISIEWDDILSIRSFEEFQLELQDGTRYFGTFEVGDADRTVRVADTSLDLALIVRILPIEAGFWKRIDGSLDAGFDYTQSSGVATYSFGADARYRTRKFEYNTSLDVDAVKQDSGTTSNTDLSFTSHRFLRNRWFTAGLVSLQRNDELGIDLRVLMGGGPGRNLIQTNRTLFQLTGGAVINEERATGDNSTNSSVELFTGMSYSVFNYDYPETDVNISLLAFPSVTESGRVRAQLNVDIRREIIKDFFVELSGYDTYDSKPEDVDASSNDWGSSLSLGWKF